MLDTEVGSDGKSTPVSDLVLNLDSRLTIHVENGANELAQAYKNAGSPSSLRGFVTNVSGWNAWKKVPGEFENTSDGPYNKGHDEDRFHTLFANALAQAGMPNHGIVDTGRSGRQGIRQEWGHWCNVNGAGFGIRPGTNTGNSNTDAFVWVKPGGESDGTSDTSATRYDSFCGMSDGRLLRAVAHFLFDRLLFF